MDSQNTQKIKNLENGILSFFFKLKISFNEY